MVNAAGRCCVRPRGCVGLVRMPLQRRPSVGSLFTPAVLKCIDSRTLSLSVSINTMQSILETFPKELPVKLSLPHFCQ